MIGLLSEYQDLHLQPQSSTNRLTLGLHKYILGYGTTTYNTKSNRIYKRRESKTFWAGSMLPTHPSNLPRRLRSVTSDQCLFGKIVRLRKTLSQLYTAIELVEVVAVISTDACHRLLQHHSHLVLINQLSRTLSLLSFLPSTLAFLYLFHGRLFPMLPFSQQTLLRAMMILARWIWTLQGNWRSDGSLIQMQLRAILNQISVPYLMTLTTGNFPCFNE